MTVFNDQNRKRNSYAYEFVGAVSITSPCTIASKNKNMHEKISTGTATFSWPLLQLCGLSEQCTLSHCNRSFIWLFCFPTNLSFKQSLRWASHCVPARRHLGMSQPECFYCILVQWTVQSEIELGSSAIIPRADIESLANSWEFVSDSNDHMGTRALSRIKSPKVALSRLAIVIGQTMLKRFRHNKIVPVEGC